MDAIYYTELIKALFIDTTIHQASSVYETAQQGYEKSTREQRQYQNSAKQRNSQQQPEQQKSTFDPLFGTYQKQSSPEKEEKKLARISVANYYRELDRRQAMTQERDKSFTR